MNEILKSIPGYPDYKVSNYGYIVSFKKHNQKILGMYPDKDGYLNVSLCNSNKQKTFHIHKLVAMCFIDNPNGFKTVDHKDGNKRNNRADNLEWMSQRKNVQKFHAEQGHRLFDMPRQRGLRKRGETKRIPIKQYSKDYVFIAEYESLMDAERQTGIRNSSISECINGRKPTAGGFLWIKK